MKKQILVLLLLIGSICSLNAQSISCNELYNVITEHYESKEEASILSSTILRSAKYYRLEDMGFVIAYIKESDYDIIGNPYIFCGISQQRWNTFKNDGMFNSWGKAFHKYIIDYTCECY